MRSIATIILLITSAGCQQALDIPPLEVCGDGIQDSGEECDVGDNIDGDGCSANCIVEYCGDGIINNTTEQCDDANLIDDDNCSNSCAVNCDDNISKPDDFHCYSSSNAATLTWQQAQVACRTLGEGWRLAALSSEQEINFIQDNATGTPLWLGGFKNHLLEPTYEWTNGETFPGDSHLWCGGVAPNTAGFACVSLNKASGCFNAAPCDDTYLYLCELTPLGQQVGAAGQ